jgi:hypothetical protein
VLKHHAVRTYGGVAVKFFYRNRGDRSDYLCFISWNVAPGKHWIGDGLAYTHNNVVASLGQWLWCIVVSSVIIVTCVRQEIVECLNNKEIMQSTHH